MDNATHENVAGNYYDKYGSQNPIVRHLMAGFLAAFDRLVAQTKVTHAHEIGCGEGKLAVHMCGLGLQVRACDISTEIVEQARATALQAGKKVQFSPKSVYDLRPPGDSAELVVCCEVLEHIADPAAALEIFASIADPYLIVSVPREPLWRILNMFRLKYMRQAGNTPGHVQHWSKPAFISLLKQRFDVLAVETPLPWTMALCRARHA